MDLLYRKTRNENSATRTWEGLVPGGQDGGEQFIAVAVEDARDSRGVTGAGVPTHPRPTHLRRSWLTRTPEQRRPQPWSHRLRLQWSKATTAAAVVGAGAGA